ncbi:unnamed protein product [Dracunculus medinensis]|uniref:Hist_deacetyl domain-containing protein n=1 Tax=Dracunculus medinensis TaxID=318479 RepID=A0A0N4UMP1_DRAME|nr:unnamed protein product [Dracunculus medinensis]
MYDEMNRKHRCLWDPNNTTQDKHERAALIHKRLLADGLLDDAVMIPTRRAEISEILLNHPNELILELEALRTPDELEEYCRKRELLWLAPDSACVARFMVGGVIDLLKANIEGRIGNAFALTRPPGHHSYANSPQGFCIYNNVAIAAKYAIEHLGIKKVIIVDIDYHCGNGTYHSVKDDERILFVNFHSYHYGAFWPYSKEYDYDNKYRNVISIPLNSTLNSEGDYIAAFNHLIIPVAHEFGAELVLVSLGFDAAYYDDLLEHGQGIKAHGYGYLMQMLHKNWPNRVLAMLEGGYFWRSYTECAAMATRGLKVGLPIPALDHPKRVNPCLADTLWRLMFHHSKNWKCVEKHLEKLQKMQIINGELRYVPPQYNIFLGENFREMWDRVKELAISRTRNWISGMTENEIAIATAKIEEYIKEYNYEKETYEFNERELLEQLLWNSERASEAYLKSIPTTMWFYSQIKKCLESDDGRYLILDMEAYYRRTRKN